MEYASKSAFAGQDEQSAVAPYLERISSLAASVEDSAGRVEEFIARCRGGGISRGDSAATAPQPSGHFAQLNRLGEAAEMLEKLTRELGSIG